MLLAADMGNTNISFGLFAGMRLVKKFDIPTAGFSPARLKAQLAGRHLSAAVICSVVPGATPSLARGVRELSGNKPLIVGKDVKVPIKNLYRHPRRLGQDRLVNAFAGMVLYGSPLIVIDSGTAMTIDVVSRKKEYLGGMILPGLGMSLDALHRNTALVPKIDLGVPREFIGRDTQSGMLSGVVYGSAAAIEGLSVKIRQRIGKDAAVIGTGGSIKLIGRYCRAFNLIDSDLTLKGLNLLFDRHKQLC